MHWRVVVTEATFMTYDKFIITEMPISAQAPIYEIVLAFHHQQYRACDIARISNSYLLRLHCIKEISPPVDGFGPARTIVSLKAFISTTEVF